MVKAQTLPAALRRAWATYRCVLGGLFSLGRREQMR